MKLGIDSYSYHRWFGELYPGLERDPGERMTLADFLDAAQTLDVEGVSLEACHLGGTALDLGGLRARLQGAELHAVWAWGHPDGLGSGARPDALDDLIANLATARAIGAPVMRICAGGRRTRPTDWATHRAGLLPLLRRATEAAAETGVVLAIENHIDLLADELIELIETINSPWLGVCLNTANNLRLGEDPLTVARRLAPLTRATHVKNIRPGPAGATGIAAWPSTALPDGVIDIGAILEALDAANYTGLLALEIDYLDPSEGEDARPLIRRSLDWMRAWLARPERTPAV